MQPVVSAQSSNLDSITNLGRVLLYQFDISDLIEDFKIDIYYNHNTCKQVDRLNILSAQDEVVDYLLDNFNQIDQNQRLSLVNNYQLLEIELEFLKEINILIKDGFEEGKQNHISAIKSNVNANLATLVDQSYERFHQKYEDRVRIYNSQTDRFEEGFYLNCPSSWLSLKNRAANIQNQISQIQNEWDALTTALSNTRKAAGQVGSLQTLKSIVSDTRSNTSEAFSNSWDSLKSELNHNKSALIKLASQPQREYAEVLKQNQQKINNRTDIGGLIISGADLTTITDRVFQVSQFRSLINQKTIDYSTSQITSSHFDMGIQQLINQSYLSPKIISKQSTIFKEPNQDGLIKLTKHIYDRQCRVNP